MERMSYKFTGNSDLEIGDWFYISKKCHLIKVIIQDVINIKFGIIPHYIKRKTGIVRCVRGISISNNTVYYNVSESISYFNKKAG